MGKRKYFKTWPISHSFHWPTWNKKTGASWPAGTLTSWANQLCYVFLCAVILQMLIKSCWPPNEWNATNYNEIWKALYQYHILVWEFSCSALLTVAEYIKRYNYDIYCASKFSFQATMPRDSSSNLNAPQLGNHLSSQEDSQWINNLLVLTYYTAALEVTTVYFR